VVADAPARWPPYAALLIIVVATVAVQGAVPAGDVQRIAVAVLLGACLVLSFRIARLSFPLLLFAWALAGMGVAVAVLYSLTGAFGDGQARGMSAIVVGFCPPAVALAVVRNLRTSREVRVEAVIGVLALYMLIGMLFAFVYGAIDTLGHAPFFAQDV